MAAWKVTVYFLLFFAISGCRAVDVVWYISPDGSGDIRTCGRSLANPCNSLQLVVSQSDLFANDTADCYLSAGDADGRDSTTVFFTGGVNFVPPLCLINWANIKVQALNGTTITSGSFGAERGIFEFINCTNVTIEGLHFDVSAINRATLFFQASRDIKIVDSSFPVLRINSIGVQILHCAGDIVLSGNRFYGDPTLPTSDQEHLNQIGLDVTHGCTFCTMPFSNEPYDFSALSFSLEIENCTFEDIVNLEAPEDSYGSVYTSAVGMRLRFGGGSTDNQASITNSIFRRIVNSKANGVLVSLGDTAQDNQVSFQRCSFYMNRVRYGGGLSAFFYNGPANNTLTVQESNFFNNTADFEGGGVFATLLSSGANNEIFVSNSTFTRSSALFGGAVYLINNPSWLQNRGAFNPAPFPLVKVELRNCVFEGNVARMSEGIVNALRARLSITGVSTFTGNTGSAVLLRVSLLNIEGSVTFSNNTAVTGGAINIREGSKVDMSEVSKGYFLDNRALFQGGAIYADASSASHLATEYNHTLAQQVFGGCFIMFGNEIRGGDERNPTRFTFRGNTAFSDGQHIHSFSLRGCLSSNFIPAEIADRFLAIPSDGTIVQENTATFDPLQSTSTGPSFLFFYGASTRCLKTVAGITYLLPNCSHDLLNSTFYLHPDMRCGLLEFTSELSSTYGVPGTGLRPTVDRLIAPWSAIEATWQEPAQTLRSQCPEPNPGGVVLSPAPGEQFDLTVQLVDQLLNFVFDTVYLEVEVVGGSGNSTGALLQFNGLQFGIRERIYFTPNRPISQVALVGAPGTTGNLRVVVASQVIGQDVVLLVPFQLAHCPRGYFLSETLKNITRVEELIAGEYSTTQRIPTDPFQPLACHCFTQETTRITFSKRVESLASTCIDGYTVQLSGSLWAGLIPGDNSTESGISDFPPSIPCPLFNDTQSIQDSLTNLVNQYRENASNSSLVNFAPVDVVPYMGIVGPGGGAPVKCFQQNISEVVTYEPAGAVFSIELCSQGYCRGDARSTWVVANESFPCAENRMGPLCGQCKPGYAVTLYSSVCRDCRDKPEHYYVALVCTLVLGVALVLLVIVLNVGASPTMDSLLFFTQAVYLLLLGRSDYENFKFLAFFNPNFTFDLCITPNLDNLTKLILQYVTPVYILSLMFLVLLMTCSNKISRLLGRHSILKGLWLLFLISYFNIAMATYEILYCQKVGPTMDGDGSEKLYVLIHDASVRCYQGLHLPFAIIAWILVIFFVLPLPVYLMIVMRVPKLKPLSDVYCSDYEDNRRWWIVISLGRRLFLVLVGVFIQDYVSRHFGLLIAISVIMLVTTALLPYKTWLDNFFVLFVTWMLLLTAIVTQPDVYLGGDPRQAVSFTLVVVTIAAGLVLLVLDIILQKVKKKSIGVFFKESVAPNLRNSRVRLREVLSNKDHSAHELEESVKSTTSAIFPKAQTVDLTGYREPLLDSTFCTSEERSDLFGTWKKNSGRNSGRNGATSSSINGQYKPYRSSGTSSSIGGPYPTSSTVTDGIVGGRGGKEKEEYDTFHRKRFNTDEDMGVARTTPTVTEVYTSGGGDSDNENHPGYTRQSTS